MLGNTKAFNSSKGTGTGTQGAQGIQGPIGLTGAQGAQGAQGIQGIPGTNANGSTVDVGIPYDFHALTRVIPPYYQYLVAGRVILDSASILRISGQVVIT